MLREGGAGGPSEQKFPFVAMSLPPGFGGSAGPPAGASSMTAAPIHPPAPPVPPIRAPAPAPATGGWKSAKADSGHVYYYHTGTGTPLNARSPGSCFEPLGLRWSVTIPLSPDWQARNRGLPPLGSSIRRCSCVPASIPVSHPWVVSSTTGARGSSDRPPGELGECPGRGLAEGHPRYRAPLFL